MKLVMNPQAYHIIVAPNLYGDILSDLAAGLVGGLGLAPSANIGHDAAIFEPVHGSAPDIANQNIANPLATVLAGSMMLAHLGDSKGATLMEEAVFWALANNKVTPDLGGNLSTSQVGTALIGYLEGRV